METREKFHITANASTLGNLRKLEITKAIADSGKAGNFMPSGSKVINIKNILSQLK